MNDCTVTLFEEGLTVHAPGLAVERDLIKLGHCLAASEQLQLPAVALQTIQNVRQSNNREANRSEKNKRKLSVKKYHIT